MDEAALARKNRRRGGQTGRPRTRLSCTVPRDPAMGWQEPGKGETRPAHLPAASALRRRGCPCVGSPRRGRWHGSPAELPAPLAKGERRGELISVR